LSFGLVLSTVSMTLSPISAEIQAVENVSAA